MIRLLAAVDAGHCPRAVIDPRSNLMKTAFLLGMALLVGSISGALATEPRAFVCKFSHGTTGKYEATWMAKSTSDTLDFTFASLDPQKGRAEFIGNVGAVSVRELRRDHRGRRPHHHNGLRVA